MYPKTLAAVLLLTLISEAIAITIGSARDFGACGGQTVTSTGNTVIIGSVGTSPGTSITGFPPGVATSLNAGNVAAFNCIADISTAYRACKAGIAPTDRTGKPLDGAVLYPGAYKYDTTAALNAGKTLTFNALGISVAQFTVDVGTQLDLFSESKILLRGGAKACNVFFCAGTSVVIGANAGVNATVIALQSISVADAMTNKGGLYGINAAVTMINDKITSCA